MDKSSDPPRRIAGNVKALLGKNENPYWAREDVARYPFVPPVVCAADYDSHPWKEVFSPTQNETREEAVRQLETLKEFRVHHLKNRNTIGLWDGTKDFAFPDHMNYLELRHKAPPSAVFREDQDPEYTREGVLRASNGKAREGTNLNDLLTDVYRHGADSFQHTEHGPGALPDIDWEKTCLE